MQVIDFEGTQHEFPDDFSQVDIAKALSSQGGAAPAAASAAPAPAQPAAAPQVPISGDPEGRYPQPREEAPVSSTSRGLTLGVNSVGKGVAGIAGLPGTIGDTGRNLLFDLIGKGADAAGVHSDFFKPDNHHSAFSSEGMNRNAGNVETALGAPDVKPESIKEKLADNATQFATQSLLSGAGLARQAMERGAEIAGMRATPKPGDSLLRPYLDNGVKTVVGDTVAGAGAGAGLTAAQEAPESVRKMGGGSVGATLDLLGMLVGGVGAGTAHNVAAGAPSKLGAVRTGAKVAEGVPLDPATKAGFANNDVDAAAKFLQGKAIDPQKAADTIGDLVGQLRAENRPVPTTGLISGDTGLEAVERGQRVKQSTGSILSEGSPETKANYSFGERDTALRDAAVNDVNALRPQGARPEAFPERAQEVGQARKDVAQRGVDQAQGRATAVERASAPAAADLNAVAGQGEGASRGIDQMYRSTRDTEHQQNRELFNAPEFTHAEVPVDDLIGTADAIRGGASRAAPLDPIVEKYTNRFRLAEVDPDTGAVVREGFEPGQHITVQDLNNVRAELEGDIANNLKNGQVVRQLRQIKDAVGQYTAELAAGGSPAGAAAQAALENHATRVQPNFREGAGGELDAKLKRNNNIRPSETASTFLTRPEDAADLQRIAALRGNEAQTAAQSRTWLFDRLAQSGVARDGRIDPEKLTRWRNANGGVIDQVPGLRAEVDTMVTDARRGADLTQRYGNDLTAAQQRLAETTRNVDQGALGAVAGKSPEKAADAIFSSRNPVETARELKGTVGRNPEADAGMKAAVAERLASKVSGVAPQNVSEGTQNINYAALVKEFNKNEKVLAEIYSPEEMNLLRRAHKTLEPLTKRSGQATTGSITAESTELAWRPFEIAAKLHFGTLKGGSITRTGKLIAGALMGNATEAPNRLIALASFDPDLARLLLTRNVKEAGSPAWNAKLQQYIRRTQAAKDVTSNQNDQQ